MALESQAGDIILVRGADGASEYAAPFDQWLGRWQEAAERWKVPVHRVGKDSVTSPVGAPENLTSTPSDRDQLLQILAALPKKSDQALWIVLVGHGTYTATPSAIARFNLVGPDVSSDELAKSLRDFDRPLILINCSSCSGAFISPLSGPNRIVLTATRSGNEQNYARFGGFLAEALHDAGSDRDHDGAVSLLEAFLTASGQTERFYKDAGRLAGEHALLEDNGDGQAVGLAAFSGVRPKRSTSQDGRAIDGTAAHGVQVLEVEPQQPLTAEQKRRRSELEEAIMQWRLAKPSMNENAYYSRLEELLLELAHLLNPFGTPDS